MVTPTGRHGQVLPDDVRSYAMAAARALLQHSDLGAEAVVRESLTIASGICVYTNTAITIETL